MKGIGSVGQLGLHIAYLLLEHVDDEECLLSFRESPATCSSKIIFQVFEPKYSLLLAWFRHCMLFYQSLHNLALRLQTEVQFMFLNIGRLWSESGNWFGPVVVVEEDSCSH